MISIVAGILSLIQYQKSLINEPDRYLPEKCLCCGVAGLWRHGHYDRKADRQGTAEESLNPISILRFFCPHCRKTQSVLPECIPPRRWYLWEVQQVVFLLLLAGKSIYAIAQEVTPSRSTIKRWFIRLAERFHFHKDALCNRFIALGRNENLEGFWAACFQILSLSEAMRFCHVSGISIP